MRQESMRNFWFVLKLIPNAFKCTKCILQTNKHLFPFITNANNVLQKQMYMPNVFREFYGNMKKPHKFNVMAKFIELLSFVNLIVRCADW